MMNTRGVALRNQVRRGAFNAALLLFAAVIAGRFTRIRTFVRQRRGRLPLTGRNSALGGRHNSRAGGRVLLIEDRVPHEWLGAGFPRTREMIETLLELGHSVTLYTTGRVIERSLEVSESVDPRVEIISDPEAKRLRRFLRTRGNRFSACIVTRPHNMQMARSALLSWRRSGHPVRLVYDAEALFSLREIAEKRMRGQTISAEEEVRQLTKELGLGEGCDAILAVSRREAEHFRRAQFTLARPDVYVLTHRVAPRLTPARFEERDGFLFVGSLHYRESPNGDALEWFVNDVLPLARSMLNRSVRLQFVGLNLTDWAPRNGSNIECLGRVSDLQPLYNMARVFVAPTRFAAGVPLKVHGAAAAGVPVVATSLLAAQLGWSAGSEISVADSAHAFAAACVQLYSDQSLWSRVREQAFARVSDDCSKERFRQVLQTVLCGGCGATSERSQPATTRAP